MAARVYELKVTIVGIAPPVWRRLQVAESTTLLALHHIIQAAFGWGNCHMHDFEIGRLRYATDVGGLAGRPARSERRTRLGEVVNKGDQFRYNYDFGDDWQHDIVVETVMSARPATRYPACVAGARACPPEDCGGVWGYQRLLGVLADPGHDDHEDMREWLGLSEGATFDPDAFVLAGSGLSAGARVPARALR